MSGFKTILVMDRPRERSPLLTQFYNYLGRPGGPFKVVRDSQTDIPLEEVVEDRLGNPPDYVYWGFTQGSGLRLSAKYIIKNKIKIICDVGDVEQFVTEHEPVASNFRHVGVDFLVARWPDVPDFHSSVALTGALKKLIWLQRAKIIHIPWAIDPSLYKDAEKDIDVSLICTMDPLWHYHRDRERARFSLEGIPVIKKVGNWYGAEYIDLLSRSKIFIVEGSGRNFLVQKYLEGAVSGAMLMGEIPGAAKDVFEDNISIGAIEDYSRVGEIVIDYLKRPEDIKRIAAEGKKRVIENYSLEKIVPAFERMICES